MGKETTKGWEICVQWKYVISTWNSLKYLKDYYPIELSEYKVENRLASKPSFYWWVPNTLHKRTYNIQDQTKVLGSIPQVWEPVNYDH